MSHLSGYDSDAVGFSSVKQGCKSESTSGTQTSELSESGVASQTAETRDCGSSTVEWRDAAPAEQPPPGLNEFLRRVVPAVLQQLGCEERTPDSDEDEERALAAKLLQELETRDEGGGDGPGAPRAAAWSCCGGSLGVAAGRGVHLYSAGAGGLRRAALLREPDAVTALRWHGAERALLALGTAAGAVAARDGRGTARPVHPAHPGARVAALLWPDAPLANAFLEMQITAAGRRRSAADRVLLSAGGDGCMCAWQVNTAASEFQLIVRYRVAGAAGGAAPDITCFDFCKSSARAPADTFVVGARCGSLYVCSVRAGGRGDAAGDAGDPVVATAGGGGAAPVTAVACSARLAAAAAGGELRLYDLDQPVAPLKVICLDETISCLVWLPIAPWAVAVGLAGQGRYAGQGGQVRQGGQAGQEGQVRVFDVKSERAVPLRGLPAGSGAVTAMAVTQNQTGSCVLAICSDRVSLVRIADDARVLNAS